MKYLKIYEEYNEFYTEINESEYSRLATDVVDFDEKYPNRITNSVGSNFRVKLLSPHVKDRETSLKSFYMMSNRISTAIIVYQLNDEYFRVKLAKIETDKTETRQPYRFFKCDQIDGLIECLKKECT